MAIAVKEIIQPSDRFADLSAEHSWAFSDLKPSDTSYITHGYYTYPAKFIPQLAARLIKRYSEPGDIVIDPFMGSGTTVVEAMVHGRKAVGVDINHIATLIAKVKTTPLDEEKLDRACDKLLSLIPRRGDFNYEEQLLKAQKSIALHPGIDRWFDEHSKNQLLLIYCHIRRGRDEDLRDFFLVAFAQILKRCSRWAQKSIKPTVDKNKEGCVPLDLFARQVRKMRKGHAAFGQMLAENGVSPDGEYPKVRKQDCYDFPCRSGEVSLIVTSPPYVTSYEYADLHQLPALWFSRSHDLREFRKEFIGSVQREYLVKGVYSPLADDIIGSLKAVKGGNGKALAVEHYFADMFTFFQEARRKLRRGGKMAVVIGNTKLLGVDILNAEVFVEQCKGLGFRFNDVICREIPSKMLPSTRDPATGKFAKASANSVLVYPREYILIMER